MKKRERTGAKDDPTDAELALDLLCRHPERLTALLPQSAPMRALHQLVEGRRRLVADRVHLTNRVSNALKNYFPKPLQWFDEKGTVLFCDFLARWPTLKQARRARRTSLRAFFIEHNHMRSANAPSQTHGRALIRASQTWQRIAINEFEQRRIADSRNELDEQLAERKTAPKLTTASRRNIYSKNRYSKNGT